MREFHYTLLADGRSDRAIMPILTWLLRQHLRDFDIQGAFADLSGLPKPPPISKIPDRMEKAVELHPCDLLFVHRDAEDAPLEHRYAEITRAINAIQSGTTTIPVVPVRMQEAWLLIDAHAIRRAAGNPNGTRPLNLPPVSRLESLPDPKEVLYSLLREASERGKRRLKQFRPQVHALDVAEFSQDFSVLRQLSAFQRLESDIVDLISNTGWLSSLT